MWQAVWYENSWATKVWPCSGGLCVCRAGVCVWLWRCRCADRPVAVVFILPIGLLWSKLSPPEVSLRENYLWQFKREPRSKLTYKQCELSMSCRVQWNGVLSCLTACKGDLDQCSLSTISVWQWCPEETYPETPSSYLELNLQRFLHKDMCTVTSNFFACLLISGDILVSMSFMSHVFTQVFILQILFFSIFNATLI